MVPEPQKGSISGVSPFQFAKRIKLAANVSLIGASPCHAVATFIESRSEVSIVNNTLSLSIAT